MKLKEAYRYSNFLNEMYETLNMYLNREDVVTKTTENHMRTQVNPDAQDEIVEVPRKTATEASANNMIAMLNDIVDEREALFEAIDAAKANADIDIDEALSMNKWKRSAIATLNRLAHLNSKETISTDTDYKFDADGKQTPYVYHKKVVQTIDFDRNEVRKLLKKYQKECDDISSEIDAIEINTDVNFNPQFDVHTSIDDILSEYA